MNEDPIVYIVDDDALMRAALQRVFVAAGIAPQAFASGDDLLDRTPLAPRGALLLDVMMPRMNGLDLQRELRRRGVTLPVIFLTGSGDVPMAVEAMRDGALDFLEKPFDNADLVARVRKAFDVSSLLPSPAVNGSAYAHRRAALTPREREVLDCMLTGQTSKVIARELGISHRTIEIHRARVMEKMQSATLAELVRMSLAPDPVSGAA